MMSLFWKLSSGYTVLRKMDDVWSKEQIISPNNTISYNEPIWISKIYRRKDLNKNFNRIPVVRGGMIYHQHRGNEYKFEYQNGPWKPVQSTIHNERLPHSRLIRSPEKKVGLGEVTKLAVSVQNPKIVNLSLKHTLKYSYMRDLRFISLTALAIGMTGWWAMTPYPILENPLSLYLTPDPEMLIRGVKDTFINKVCTVHNLPSPCECSEPLNKTAQKMFEQGETFDPLALRENERQSLVKGLAISYATIVLCLALSESVSIDGIRLDDILKSDILK